MQLCCVASCRSFHPCVRVHWRVHCSMGDNPSAAQVPEDALWDPSWEPGAGEATILARSEEEEGNPSAITLFCAWFCPFAQRAWIALEEKEVNYRYVEINTYQVDPQEPGGYTKQPLSLEEKSRKYPDFVAASPRGLVPAVTHVGQHIWESIHVVEYIDTVFTGGSQLVPHQDPLKSAHVKIWADHCTDRIQKAYYVALMEQDSSKQQASLEAFFDECRMLARAMAPPSSGPYFLGSTFSLVDVALAPFWQRFIIVGGHYRGLTFPEDPEFHRLKAWWQAVKKRPSVASTFVSEGRLIASYKQYANNTGTSDFAKALQGAISKPAANPVAPLPSCITATQRQPEALPMAEGVEASAADALASVSRAAVVNGSRSKRSSEGQYPSAPSRRNAGHAAAAGIGVLLGAVLTKLIGQR